MITFKPCVTYKRRDGTYQVRIRVTFARKSRYLATTLTAYPSQLTRSLRLRDGALIASADNLIRQMRSTVADLNPFALEGRSVDWVCDYIKAKRRGSSVHLRFFHEFDCYVQRFDFSGVSLFFASEFYLFQCLHIVTTFFVCHFCTLFRLFISCLKL